MGSRKAKTTSPLKAVFATAFAALFAVAVTGIGAKASDSSPSPIAHAQVACGVKVYMTSSGTTSQDTTNDGLVKASLENGTDLCITIGVGFYDLSTVSGSVTTTNYDVIYVQGQNNWTSTFLNQFDASDYQVIDSFITAGGGVVIGEWLSWDSCAKSYAGAWNSLATIMPITIRSGCAYGSNQNVRFYRWNRPLSPLVDTGVGADFIFQPADFAGSLSFFDLKNGATPYYWATWNPVVANIPAAVDPANLPTAGGVGMAGWVPSGKVGRVFAFSTTNGAPELADTTSSNSFRRLLINSLGWSGSVGGSINPDSIASTSSGSGVVSTQALVPTRIVGTVTYSVVGGTLPPGTTLNSATGQITGTSTQNGTYSVTIAATGSVSGSAQAVVTVTVTGVAAPVTTVAPTTTAPPATTVAPTTTAASATTLAPSTTAAASVSFVTGKTTTDSKTSTLPKSGGTPLPLVEVGMFLLIIGTCLTGVRRRFR